MTDSEALVTELDRELQDASEGWSRRTGNRLNRGSRSLSLMIARSGPVAACQGALRSDMAIDVVADALRHMDTTVERIVLDDRFGASLFTREDVERAAGNLATALTIVSRAD